MTCWTCSVANRLFPVYGLFLSYQNTSVLVTIASWIPLCPIAKDPERIPMCSIWFGGQSRDSGFLGSCWICVSRNNICESCSCTSEYHWDDIYGFDIRYTWCVAAPCPGWSYGFACICIQIPLGWWGPIAAHGGCQLGVPVGDHQLTYLEMFSLIGCGEVHPWLAGISLAKRVNHQHVHISQRFTVGSCICCSIWAGG